MPLLKDAESQQWISWDLASELTGIKVPTIEHAVRVGRIERRPRLGGRPSLRRDSVFAWAEWYLDTDQQREARRERRARRKSTPAPDGWLSTAEAGCRLNRTPKTVMRWIQLGKLVAEFDGVSWWVDPDSVKSSAERRGEWVSWVEAARIVGCSASQIRTAVGKGELTQRQGPSARPSLERASVEAYRDRRANEPTAVRNLTPPPSPSSAPDDGEVWLSTAVVAIMLRTQAGDVSRLVRLGRLPGVKRGARVWVRRDHAEAAAAARAFQEPQRTAPTVRA